jgi:hypothetical protein
MSKELLNFMTWVNQDEKLGYTSIGIERIVNRYITSKDLIIRDAYQNYVKTHRVGFLGIKNTIMSQEEFINKCKTDDEFSEKWGLTIEERELSLEERYDLIEKDKHTQFVKWESLGTDRIKEVLDEKNIPTKLITIKYNDKKIESYE